MVEIDPPSSNKNTCHSPENAGRATISIMIYYDLLYLGLPFNHLKLKKKNSKCPFLNQ